jgi:PAP2 superfamily
MKLPPRLLAVGAAVIAAAALPAGSVAATVPASPGGDAAVRWNQTLLQIVRTPGAQPATIHSTRSFAALHVAMYDAIEAIDGHRATYALHLRHRPSASDTAAAEVAAHDVLVNLYPAMKDTLDGQETSELAELPAGPRTDRGIAVGQKAAAAVLAKRVNDGSGVTPPVYMSTGAPGAFDPAPPTVAVFTHWGAVAPWVLDRGPQFRPPAPPALSSNAYARAINEVQSLGKADSVTRTEDQTQIARFWAAPIQNYWNEIAQTAALARHRGPEADAWTFAALNLSLADSAIAFYDAKYAYRLWRPITAIRDADRDGNDATVADPSWTPLAATPADPSYPGAHSAVSGAAAEILKAAYGEHHGFAVTSEVLPGVRRSFATFAAAEDEAALSRVFAGVHSRLDDPPGRRLGTEVARFVLGHALGTVGHDPSRPVRRHRRDHRPR